MSCYNPIPLSVTVRDKNNPDDIGVNIPILADCGKCYSCRQKRLTNWSLRLTHEYQTNFVGNMIMVTLTYDDLHIKSNSLDYRDIQLFLKRVRKNLNHKIKYMVVGEYGFQTERKHWHLIILGLNRTEHYNLIKKCWSYGFIVVKNADVNSVKYLLKYSFKQQFKNRKYYEKQGKTPPLFRVSQGFGKDYLFSHANILKERQFFYRGNFKVAMPRYYKKKLIEFGFLAYDYYLADYDIIKICIGNLNSLGNIPPTVIHRISNILLDDSLRMGTRLLCYTSHFKDYAKTINKLKYDKFLKDFKEVI